MWYNGLMNIPTLPFTEEDGIVKLVGPVLLQCGCGSVVARWATLQQSLSTRIPQAKPKASRIANKWIEQEKLAEKFPQLKKHVYGLVVAETENGIESVDIQTGATSKVAEEIGSLIRRSNEYRNNH